MATPTTGPDGNGTMPAAAPLLLASRSPRRAELLGLLGVRFERLDVEIDESTRPGEAPQAYVLRVALGKAAAAGHPDRAVLAADTCVSCDGALFGKPADHAAARAMLRRLAGRWHDVHTAVVVRAAGQAPSTAVVATRVEFVAFDDAVIDRYWASGEPADKAGAYGIQGLGGALVRRIEGSYGAVVGLPLAETAALLRNAGIGHALAPADGDFKSP